MGEIDPDTLLREQLAEHNPMWSDLADVLDEWLHRMHGVAGGRHNIGLFLRLLDGHNWLITSKPRTFTELQLLAAVEAGQVWHEFDHDHVILEDDYDQEEIDEQFGQINHLASCRGGSVYRLTDEGKARLVELRAEVSS